LLTKDPTKRPTIEEVLKEPLIQKRLMLIVDEYILGDKILEIVKEQLLGLNLMNEAFVQEEAKRKAYQAQQRALSLLKAAALLQPPLPPAHLFTTPDLDKLLQSLNTPLANFTPSLNIKGQSKLAEYILKHGWKWPLEMLNCHANADCLVEWGEFKHERFGDGVYYGQVAGGKRHGYGFAYCADASGQPVLFECQWNGGTPCGQGRYTVVVERQWKQWEGEMDETYTITGCGSY